MKKSFVYLFGKMDLESWYYCPLNRVYYENHLMGIVTCALHTAAENIYYNSGILIAIVIFVIASCVFEFVLSIIRWIIVMKYTIIMVFENEVGILNNKVFRTTARIRGPNVVFLIPFIESIEKIRVSTKQE